jgi:hypothetical protein
LRKSLRKKKKTYSGELVKELTIQLTARVAQKVLNK